MLDNPIIRDAILKLVVDELVALTTVKGDLLKDDLYDRAVSEWLELTQLFFNEVRSRL